MQFQFSEFMSILQILILVCGLISAIRQLNLLRAQLELNTKQIKNQLEWQKKKATFDYLNMYVSTFKDLNTNLQKKLKLLEHDNSEMDVPSFQKIMADENTRAELFHLVSYFETLSIGISEEYFDESTAKYLLYNVVISTFKSLRPYLLIRREETDKEVASNFEKLALRWDFEPEP